MENFYEKLAEILETDQVNDTDELKSFDCWDSLTILSIIALASEEYGVTLTANEINSLTTVDNLKQFIASKK
jgi:acyl carrier protein